MRTERAIQSSESEHVVQLFDSSKSLAETVGKFLSVGLRQARALGQICEAHGHVHRKADDILAEYLLEQPAVKAAQVVADSSRS